MFEAFIDWGDGYNGRLLETQDIRYDKDTTYKNAAWNPYHHSTYGCLSYPIPYVTMSVSTDDNWWDPTISLPTYTIQGTVILNGNPLAGIKIDCSNGRSATTDGSGSYSIVVDSNATVTLTPSSTKYNFTPPSITCSKVSANLTNQNFIAVPVPTYTIQGTVTYEDDPLQGVTISCTNGNSAVTDVNGEYSITVDSNETVTLTPSFGGFTFTPPTITCPNVSTNLTDKDFIATPPTYTLQGKVIYSGNGLPGVTIDCTNGTSTVTDASGDYTIMVSHNETVSLTPSLSGYTFSPPSISIADIVFNFVKLNFTASGVGIPTITDNSVIRLYPNPAKNELQINNEQ
jgi:hypothetical protein